MLGETLCVVLDVVLVVAPSVALCWHALHAADLDSRISPTISTSEKPRVYWLAFTPTSLPLFSSHKMTWLAAFCLYESGAFLFLSIIRLADNYLVRPAVKMPAGIARSHRIWRRIYGLVFMVDAFFKSFFLSMIGSYTIFATLMAPEKLLPVGTAIVTILGTASTVAHQMLASASRLKQRVNSLPSLL